MPKTRKDSSIVRTQGVKRSKKDIVCKDNVFVDDVTTDNVTTDFLSFLPAELMEILDQFLDWRDRRALCLTCRRFVDYFSDLYPRVFRDTLWHSLAKSDRATTEKNALSWVKTRSPFRSALLAGRERLAILADLRVGALDQWLLDSMFLEDNAFCLGGKTLREVQDPTTGDGALSVVEVLMRVGRSDLLERISKETPFLIPYTHAWSRDPGSSISPEVEEAVFRPESFLREDALQRVYVEFHQTKHEIDRPENDLAHCVSHDKKRDDRFYIDLARDAHKNNRLDNVATAILSMHPKRVHQEMDDDRHFADVVHDTLYDMPRIHPKTFLDLCEHLDLSEMRSREFVQCQLGKAQSKGSCEWFFRARRDGLVPRFMKPGDRFPDACVSYFLDEDPAYAKSIVSFMSNEALRSLFFDMAPRARKDSGFEECLIELLGRLRDVRLDPLHEMRMKEFPRHKRCDYAGDCVTKAMFLPRSLEDRKKMRRSTNFALECVAKLPDTETWKVFLQLCMRPLDNRHPVLSNLRRVERTRGNEQNPITTLEHETRRGAKHLIDPLELLDFCLKEAEVRHLLLHLLPSVGHENEPWTLLQFSGRLVIECDHSVPAALPVLRAVYRIAKEQAWPMLSQFSSKTTTLNHLSMFARLGFLDPFIEQFSKKLPGALYGYRVIADHCYSKALECASEGKTKALRYLIDNRVHRVNIEVFWKFSDLRWDSEDVRIIEAVSLVTTRLQTTINNRDEGIAIDDWSQEFFEEFTRQATKKDRTDVLEYLRRKRPGVTDTAVATCLEIGHIPRSVFWWISGFGDHRIASRLHVDITTCAEDFVRCFEMCMANDRAAHQHPSLELLHLELTVQESWKKSCSHLQDYHLHQAVEDVYKSKLSGFSSKLRSLKEGEFDEKHLRSDFLRILAKHFGTRLPRRFWKKRCRELFDWKDVATLEILRRVRSDLPLAKYAQESCRSDSTLFGDWCRRHFSRCETSSSSSSPSPSSTSAS